MRILMGIVAVLIGYGSFFPFDYAAHQPAVADLWLLWAWPQRVFVVDAAGNLLLFLPLGLCMAAVARSWGARAAWLVAGILFAWVLQYLQFWFPSREPSGSDAWFNMAGLLAGLLAGGGLQGWLRSHTARLAEASPLWPIAAGLMLLWVVYRWFPLVPALDLAHLRDALAPLLFTPRWSTVRVLHDTAGWLLWFLLARHLPFRASGWGMSLAAVAVLVVEPFFWRNALSLSNVAGLGFALLARRWMTEGPHAAHRVLVLLAASIVASGLLQPWPRFGLPQRFLFMPFAGLLYGNMLLNTAALVEKCFLYGGAVVLLGRLGLRLPWAGVLLALGLLGIEWAQRWSPGRTPELTDPLLALLLGWIFHLLLAARAAAARAEPAVRPPAGATTATAWRQGLQ